MSKLAVHYQTLPGWAVDHPADYNKIVDPLSTDPWPGYRTIGRVFVPDGEANAMVMRGAAGAGEWFNRCKPAYDRSPWIWAWEGPNEPPVATAEQRAALVAFTRAWTFMMHAYWRRVVVLCLGVGWPDIGTALDLAGALEEADYWSLHEYSAPSMQSNASWYCLRYRRTVAELRAAGSRIPPLLITECGIDGGVVDRPKTGWKTFVDEGAYRQQLAWYNGELCKDDYVVAGEMYTAGPNWDWIDFEVPESLAQYVLSLPGEAGQAGDTGGTVSDPRADNCKAFHLDAAGKVDGVELVYVPNPSTRYELIKAELISEAEAAGNTVAAYAVYDKSSIPTGERVYLAWPFPNLTNHLLPGNPNAQHMIVNGYTPPAIGPLAMYVGDAAGNPISDVIGGLGLPGNRHVCYRMAWRERGSVTVEPPPVEPPPVEPPASQDVLSAIAAVAADVRLVLAKLSGNTPPPAAPPVPPFALARPLPDGIGGVVQGFGVNPDFYAPYGLAGHEGMDYAAPAGTPVLASHAGRAQIRNSDAYGLHIIITGDDGTYRTYYAHLEAVLVTEDEHVNAGSQIGNVGSSGRSTGAHLHFGWKINEVANPAYQDFIDPLLGRKLHGDA